MDVRSEVASRVIDLKLQCGELSHALIGEEFRSMYYLIHKIGVAINSVAKRLAIEPGILEMLMHCLPYFSNRKVDTVSIADMLSLDYCEYFENTNSLVIAVGQDEHVVPLHNVIPDIKSFIMPELGPLAFDKVNLNITTKLTDLYIDQPMTITGIYEIFKDINDLFVTSRMKGLGQMPKDILRQTCLDKSSRSFVTVTSLGDIECIYRVLGVDTQARKDLVSKYVSGEDDEFLL